MSSRPPPPTVVPPGAPTVVPAVVLAAALATVTGPGPLEAQTPTDPFRSRIGASAGIVFGSGADCHGRTAFGGDVELRARGAWLLAGSLGALVSAEACSFRTGAYRLEEGTSRFESAGLPLAPRFVVRVGRAGRLWGLVLEPSPELGVLAVGTRLHTGDDTYVSPWYGLSLGVRGRGHPLGVRIGTAKRDLPVRHYRPAYEWDELVREFGHRVTHLGIRLVW